MSVFLSALMLVACDPSANATTAQQVNTAQAFVASLNRLDAPAMLDTLSDDAVYYDGAEDEKGSARTFFVDGMRGMDPDERLNYRIVSNLAIPDTVALRILDDDADSEEIILLRFSGTCIDLIVGV